MALSFPCRHGARFALAGSLLASLAATHLAHAQLVNDPVGEPASAHQSYPSLASLNGLVVAAFADFRTGNSNRIRCSYSADTGRTWIQLGIPPAPAGARWVTDPRVVASPVHGKFFVFGGANDYPVHGALFAFVPLSFPSGVPTWGTPGVVRVSYVNSPQTFAFAHDAAVSLATGRLIVASFLGDTTGAANDTMGLQFSDNEGASWSAPFTPDSFARAWPRIRVHDGKVYLLPMQGFPAYLAVAAESDLTHWTVSTLPQLNTTASAGYPPGVTGNDFDLDDSGGPHDGRIHAAWNETYVFMDDPVPDPITGANPVVELEPNGSFVTATPAAAGDVLRGTSAASGTDADYYMFHLNVGEPLILWPDSMGANVTTLTITVSDSLGVRQILRRAQGPSGGKFTFVAAATGGHAIRFTANFSAGSPPGYRLRTALGILGAEPARDHADIVAAWSDDDGTTWSEPRRVSTTAIGMFDNNPIVEVAQDGRPQVGWWTRTEKGGLLDARWRAARSNDAGQTWQLGRIMTTTPEIVNWSMPTGTIFGTGAMLAMPDRIVHAFTELQLTTPVNADVRAFMQGAGLAFAGCYGDLDAVPGGTVEPGAYVENADGLFAAPVSFEVTLGRNWPGGPYSGFTGAGSPSWAGFQMAVPDTAAAGDVSFEFALMHLGDTLAVCSGTIHVEAVVGVAGSGAVAFGFGRVWPNPATSLAHVRFAVPGPAWVTMDVMDVHGRRVARLADALYGAGEHRIDWAGRETDGRRLPAGVYLLDLRAGAQRDVRRLVLLE